MEPFISAEDLDSLIDKMKNNLPYSCTMYNNLLLHTRGIIDAHQFYVLKDHPESDVIFYKGKIIENNVAVFCCESEIELVTSALLETDLIDWKNDLFCHTPDYLVPTIQRLIQEKNDQIGISIINCDGYAKSSLEDAVSCPNEYCVRVLGAAGVKCLYETWKFKEESTEELQHKIAAAGLAIGLYEKDIDMEQRDSSEIEIADDSAIPVSWMTMSVDGSLGILKTKEAHQRKGLASVVGSSTATAAANKGYVPHVYIESDNPASKKLFEKLGWTKTHEASWIYPELHKTIMNLQ